MERMMLIIFVEPMLLKFGLCHMLSIFFPNVPSYMQLFHFHKLGQKPDHLDQLSS